MQNREVFFIKLWLLFHPAWCCLLRTGGDEGRVLLNRQNLLSMMKVICPKWAKIIWSPGSNDPRLHELTNQK